MSRRRQQGLAVFCAVLGFAAFTSGRAANADLTLAPSCSNVPLDTEIDRAAAAAALPTFVGVNQICALQALLATVGALPGSRAVDGRYDRQTRDSLKVFQSSQALKANGLLTPDTMDALASAALDQIYAADPVVTSTPLVVETPTLLSVETAETSTSSPTISEALEALQLTAPVAVPQLTLSEAPGLIEIPQLELSQPKTDLGQAPVEESLAPARNNQLSSSDNGDGGTITRATSTVETTAEMVAEVAAEVIEPVEDFLAQADLSPLRDERPVEDEPLVTLAPARGEDPLASTAVSDFVEASICQDVWSVQDRDLLRNKNRLPTGLCFRSFDGAGNLPYRVYTLEAPQSGPSFLLVHDGDDGAFDAAIASLSQFGGRVVAIQSNENTRTTLEGANPEILAVSPASNARCEWADVEKPLSFAVHDYLVSADAPVMVLRRNETRQSILDRFSDGKVRFDLSNLGPSREVFSPTIEPLSDQSFLEMMVTSSTRRSDRTTDIVKLANRTGLPVALTLVDALGGRDQCSIEALALQTDQPVARLILGKTKGARAASILAVASEALGFRELNLPTSGEVNLASAGSNTGAETAVGTDGAIPASILALAAGGLDADLDSSLSLQQSTPRTIADALAPGLPPLPLDRPEERTEDTLLANNNAAENRAPTNRFATGIAAGTGVDALAPVAFSSDGQTLSSTATVALGQEGFIVEEAVGPVGSLPPNPILRPGETGVHRVILDGTDPLYAMLGEDYVPVDSNGLRILDPNSAEAQRALARSNGTYTTGVTTYDPNVGRVISSRTIQTTVPSNGYIAPSTTQTYTTTTTGGVSGPLYSNGNQVYVPTAPAGETVIINNSIY